MNWWDDILLDKAIGYVIQTTRAFRICTDLSWGVRG